MVLDDNLPHKTNLYNRDSGPLTILSQTEDMYMHIYIYVYVNLFGISCAVAMQNLHFVVAEASCL